MEPSHPTYVIRHIEDPSLTRLKKFGRQHDATINDLLIAAFYMAALTHLEPLNKTSLPIQFTVDMRRYIKDNSDTGIANLSSAVDVWLPANINLCFEDVLMETCRQLKRIKQRNPGLGATIALDLLFLAGYARARSIFMRNISSGLQARNANPILSNFGRLDDELLNFDGRAVRRAYLVGPNLLVPGLMMCASGFRRSLTLSVGYDESTISGRLIRRFVNTMHRELITAGKNTC